MERRVLFWAAIALLLSSCAVPTPGAASGAPQAKDFEATIARIERGDPGSPTVLSAQLAYADFLLNQEPPRCAARLERAQEQLGSVEASPLTNVMFPEGWARISDLEYRLHLARAACGSDAARASELRSAVTAALRAVEQYRNVFDYNSMVVMQFDASIALHELGDNAAALTALETAIEMDREFGFADDATENYQLLLSWRGQPADAAQVAVLMRDFPKRQAVLRFGWRPSDARITLETRRECLTDGQIASSRAAAAFERHIASDAGGWVVSYANRLTGYQPGVWPTLQNSKPPQITFPPALLPASFRVSAAGEFAGVSDAEAFSSQLVSKAQQLIRAAAPSGTARMLISEAAEHAAGSLSAGMLEAATAQTYQLETATWIGATLDQGVWYQISAPLSLPGMPDVIVQHRIDFALTRTLSCTAATKAPKCVEIVFHATPEQESLDRALADISVQLQLPRFVHFYESTAARVVTDPATLMPYAREARVYWYVSSGKNAKGEFLESEHLLSTMSYRTD